MKKIVLGAALAAAATTAQAADLPRKAPVYKAPILQVYDWTGFYIGVNAGGSVGRDRTRSTIAGFTNEQSHLSPAGAIGGGQIGYNIQFRNFYNLVLGVEADIQASGQRDSFTRGLNNNAAAFTTYNQEIDWFGTARVRAGIATGPVLTYVTGGYAYGNINTSISATTFLGPTTTQTVDKTRGGYVFGTGVEAQLGGNWTGKVEYLYIDLGTQRTAGLIGTTPFTNSSKIQDHIFRAGLNYNFGNNAAYVAPVANWTGFYLGGNIGSIIGRDRSRLTTVASAPQFTLAPEGFIGGGQIGYNWQAGAFVFGIEADFQGTSARDKKACVFNCNAVSSVIPEQKLSYLGTVRGRLGYSVGSTLFYATGGYAYGETKTRLTETSGLFVPVTSTIELKRSKGGYVVGAGIENSFNPFNLFGPNWTSTTEYLYVDLGRSTFNFTTAALGPQTFSTQTREHIFRTGINYHFNTPVPAVVAKY